MKSYHCRDRDGNITSLLRLNRKKNESRLNRGKEKLKDSQKEFVDKNTNTLSPEKVRDIVESNLFFSVM